MPVLYFETRVVDLDTQSLTFTLSLQSLTLTLRLQTFTLTLQSLTFKSLTFTLRPQSLRLRPRSLTVRPCPWPSPWDLSPWPWPWDPMSRPWPWVTSVCLLTFYVRTYIRWWRRLQSVCVSVIRLYFRSWSLNSALPRWMSEPDASLSLHQIFVYFITGIINSTCTNNIDYYF